MSRRILHPARKADAGRSRESGTVTLSQEAMRRLMSYQWPGNVRQLENAIERAVAFSGRLQIGVEDLPPELQDGTLSPMSRRSPCRRRASTLCALVATSERELIQSSLETLGGNKDGPRGCST